MPPVDLSVIAPCLNEEGNVDELVRRTLQTLDLHGIDGQLVLVDDGSTDRTWERIQRWASVDSRVVGVQHLRNQGMVAGWRTGLDASTGRRVCLLDSDLQNRPEDVARLAAAHSGRDVIVQGVRHPNRSGLNRLAFASRLFFSRALNLLLNVVFRMRLRDNKSGFVLCHRDALAAVLSHRFNYDYFQCFVGPSAAALRLRFVEVDTRFDDRRAGHSFLRTVPVTPSLRILWEIVKFRVELWTRTADERTIKGADEAPALDHLDAERWNDTFAQAHDINAYYSESGFLIRHIESQRLATIRRLIEARRNDSLLEVGCGGGHVLRLFPEAQLTGVDVSGEMLKRARANLAGLSVRLLKGELQQLDLPAGSFDRIICTEVLEHAVEPELVLSEIRRLLRPGGTVVITFPNDHLINRLKSLIRRSGLTLLPPLRRISWGGDRYHLHAWYVPEMRRLLSSYFQVTEVQFVPHRLLPIRCCFLCRA
jgi:glycosyltransferase involved in cell wall biosynthesis